MEKQTQNLNPRSDRCIRLVYYQNYVLGMLFNTR